MKNDERSLVAKFQVPDNLLHVTARTPPAEKFYREVTSWWEQERSRLQPDHDIEVTCFHGGTSLVVRRVGYTAEGFIWVEGRDEKNQRSVCLAPHNQVSFRLTVIGPVPQRQPQIGYAGILAELPPPAGS